MTKEIIVPKDANKILSQITDQLLNIYPVKIYTDKLLQYETLIPSIIHCTKKYGINHIERKNLTLRTHLKVNQAYHLLQQKYCYVTCLLDDLFLRLN